MSNKFVDNLSFLKLYNKRDFKVAFKRGQRVLAHYAEHSNQKELNAEITLLDGFYIYIMYRAKLLQLYKCLTSHLSWLSQAHQLQYCWSNICQDTILYLCYAVRYNHNRYWIE